MNARRAEPGGARIRSDRVAPGIRWGLGDAAGGFLAALVLSSMFAAAWIDTTGRSTADLAGLAVAQVGLWAGLLGAPLLASRRKGAADLNTDFGFSARWTDLSGLLIGAACQLIAVPVFYWLVQLVTGGLDVDGPARQLSDKAHGPAFILLALLVVVVAPIIEELFYRGLLLRAAERRWGTRPAIIVSAAVFGASHFEIVQFPALFGLGIVLAVLTIRRGRLGPAIAAHVAFNAVTIAALALAR